MSRDITELAEVAADAIVTELDGTDGVTNATNHGDATGVQGQRAVSYEFDGKKYNMYVRVEHDTLMRR